MSTGDVFDDGLFDYEGDEKKEKRGQIEGGVGDFDHVLSLQNSVGDQPLGLMPTSLDKVPVLKQWTTRSVVKCHDPDYLRAQWQRLGEPNVGLVLGADCGPQGCVVVDPDNEAGQEWCRKNLPATPVGVRSARGMHLLYAHPQDGRVRNSADVLGSKERWNDDLEDAGYDVRGRQAKEAGLEGRALADHIKAEQDRAEAEMGLCPYPLIDIKGDGGYSVAPGSRHKSGHVYDGVGFDPSPWGQRPVFDRTLFPERYKSRYRKFGTIGKDIAWLRSLAKETDDGGLAFDYDKRECTPARKKHRAKRYLEKLTGAVSGSGGHNDLFFATCRVFVAFDLTYEDAFDLMSNVYNPKCSPPWEDHELDHKLEQAASCASEPRGCMLIDRAEYKQTKTNTPEVFIPDSWVPDPDDDEPDESQDERLEADSDQFDVSDETLDAETEDDAVRVWASVGVHWPSLKASGLDARHRYRAGKPYIPPTVPNLLAILCFSERWHGKLAYNGLRQKGEFGGQELTDHHEKQIWSGLEYLLDCDVPKSKVQAAVDLACLRNAYDPVLDYLDGREWDGKSRLWLMAQDILGVKKNEELAAAMVARFMISAAARALAPGCKVDTALIIKGSQGLFKSTFFATLFAEAFTDSNINIKDKDSLTLLATNWCWEWSELQHVTDPRKVNYVKNFITMQNDQYRSPYDRHLKTSPRRSVIVGTTNDDVIVYDDTGSRRFWIVEVEKHINLDLLKEQRDQLWAEARHLASQCLETGPDPDCQWWLTPAEDGERVDAEGDYRPVDAWTEEIEEIAKRFDSPFTINDIFKKMAMTTDKKTGLSKKRAGQVLANLGYKKSKKRMGKVRINVYQPLDVDEL